MDALGKLLPRPPRPPRPSLRPIAAPGLAALDHCREHLEMRAAVVLAGAARVFGLGGGGCGGCFSEVFWCEGLGSSWRKRRVDMTLIGCELLNIIYIYVSDVFDVFFFPHFNASTPTSNMHVQRDFCQIHPGSQTLHQSTLFLHQGVPALRPSHESLATLAAVAPAATEAQEQCQRLADGAQRNDLPARSPWCGSGQASVLQWSWQYLFRLGGVRTVSFFGAWSWGDGSKA